MHFIPTAVYEIIPETKDSVSLVFDLGHSSEELDHFLPGQHLNIKVNILGIEYRRSYSISSIYKNSNIKITIKKVHNGIVSNFLCNKIKKGDLIEISKPEGHFTIEPDHERRQKYYFFAAGSGITPIFSMIQSLLEYEPKSILYLFYGNRNESDIIFHKELNELKLKYEGQLFIEYTLTQVKRSVLPFLSKTSKAWTGQKGRINEISISGFLNNYPAKNQNHSYYLCGPGEFIENVKTALIKISIDPKSIHAEYFSTPISAIHETPKIGFDQVHLTVHLNNKKHELIIPAKKKILNSLIDAKLDPPYSCSSGACSTCMAKLLKGQVHMDVSLALEPEEIEQGYILTCQALPLTENVEIQY